MNPPMPVPGAQRIRRKNASRPLGRRALSWAAGLFLLSQAALGLVVANNALLFRDPIRHRQMKILRAHMAEASSPPRVVVLLGSSRVEMGLRSRLVSREVSEGMGRPVVAANQAASGAGPFRSLLAIDRMLRDGVIPDLVVLEILPVLFSRTFTHEDASEAVLPPRQLDEADIGLIRRHGFDRPDLEPAWAVDRLFPAYHHHANLLNYVASWLLPPAHRRRPGPEEAVQGEWSPERRAKALAHARREYHQGLQNLALGAPRQVGAVDELVGRMRATGTKVVFLAMPEGPVFRSWYAPDRWSESAAWLRGLAARHGVPLIDAREWTDDEGLFNDSHHLNDDGAERFSRWLAREVLVPQLKAEE